MSRFAQARLRQDAPAELQRVMIIDDDDLEQMLTRRVLQRSGLVEEILQFRSAEMALGYLQRPDCKPIDVILLDVNMPRMNGFEFLEAAAETTSFDKVGCVVVMLTTSLDPADRARAGQFAVVRDYIPKPLEVDAVARLSELVSTQIRAPR